MYAVAIDRGKKDKWLLTARIYHSYPEAEFAIGKLKRVRAHLMLSESNYKIFEIKESNNEITSSAVSRDIR